MPRGIPQAKNAVVAPKGYVDAEDFTAGQDSPRMLKSTGDAKDALERPYIQVVDRPVDPEKLEMMAFMEQPVRVFIHSTADPQAEQVFEIFNNGQRELFTRGEAKTVKRKFVNELATRKVTTFVQQRVRDDQGVMHDRQVPKTSIRYPFSIEHDPHPRGADWLKATLAQP